MTFNRVNDINKFVDVAHNATYKEREDRGLVNVPPMTVGFAKGVRGSKLGAEIADAKKVVAKIKNSDKYLIFII